jgi:hypothetical protein
VTPARNRSLSTVAARVEARSRIVAVRESVGVRLAFGVLEHV